MEFSFIAVPEEKISEILSTDKSDSEKFDEVEGYVSPFSSYGGTSRVSFDYEYEYWERVTPPGSLAAVEELANTFRAAPAEFSIVFEDRVAEPIFTAFDAVERMNVAHPSYGCVFSNIGSFTGSRDYLYVDFPDKVRWCSGEFQKFSVGDLVDFLEAIPEEDFSFIGSSNFPKDAWLDECCRDVVEGYLLLQNIYLVAAEKGYCMAHYSLD